MAGPAMTIDGDVVAVHSFWTGDRSRIVTEAVVRTGKGEDVVVRQLGGTVDGIGMITMPGPPPLEPGMRVAIAAHRGMDRAQREHVVLDSTRILGYAPGFVRTGRTKVGNYLYWESGCIFMTVDSAGTSALDGDQEFAIIDDAIATWNDGTASCSFMQMKTDPRKPVEVGNDKINVIKFRDDTWCRPATDDDPEHCYSAQAAGITTAVYVDDSTSDRDGAILDADVELNNVNFAISHRGATNNTTEGCLSELQNTLTHELGHVHGLEHPCLAPGDPPRMDNNGNPVPSCFPEQDLPPEIRSSTMFNFQSCGEQSKEVLSADDKQSMCDIYPLAEDSNSCERVGETSAGCCSTTGRSDRPDVGLVLAGATLLLVVRRRRAKPLA